MLGVLINRVLLMLLGYAYPAFECYKSVEKKKVDIEELRFWCQFWIIVAVLSTLERVGDIFISWLPMYGEAKVAMFVYLWYPKVKGTAHVYSSLLRPYLSKHEADIDRKLVELRARAWDYFMFNFQSFFLMGQSSFFNFLQFMAGQTAKVSNNSYKETSKSETPASPTATPTKSKSGQAQFPDKVKRRS